MKHHFILIILLCGLFPTLSQNKYQHFIIQSKNGESLPFSLIRVDSSQTIYTTNEKGAISFPKSNLPFFGQILYPGIQKSYILFAKSSKDTVLITAPSITDLSAVNVFGKPKEKGPSSNLSGVIEMNREILQALPYRGGEKDVLAAVQLMPGVQSGNEGTRGIFVRGGSPDQSLITIDQTPVYNISHLYGFLSVLNADAVSSLKIHKNHFPARLGGRLASVVEIESAKGNLDKWKGNLKVGVANTSLFLEGPVIPSKLSTQVAVRGTYAGLIAKPISGYAFRKAGNEGSLSYNFYDINSLTRYVVSNKDQIELSLFRTQDFYEFNEDESVRYENFSQLNKSTSAVTWSNTLAGLNWKHHFKNQLSTQTHFHFSLYNLQSKEKLNYEEEKSGDILNRINSVYSNQNYIQDFGFRSDWIAALNDDINLEFGVNSTLRRFLVGNGKYKSETLQSSIDTAYNVEPEVSIDNSAYVDASYQSKRFTVNIGIHFNAYIPDSTTYFFFQPRVALNYNLYKNLNLRASVFTNSQNIHLLASSRADVVSDLWVPANSALVPERGWQANLGLSQSWKQGWEWSIDAYYREMKNVIEYKTNSVNILYGKEWTKQVTGKGKGWSYGMEVFASKSVGKIKAWVKYNLMWSTRKFEDLNDGIAYPYKYDRRHDVSLVLLYKINSNWSVTASWVYGSGNRITAQSTQYASSYTHEAYQYFANNNIPISNIFPAFISAPVARNNYRLPSYHHLDLSVDYSVQKKSGRHGFNISIYNVYNRFNIFTVFSDYKLRENGSYSLSFKKISLFPIFPSITYQFQFDVSKK